MKTYLGRKGYTIYLKDFKILGIRPFKSYSAADIGFVDSFPLCLNLVSMPTLNNPIP